MQPAHNMHLGQSLLYHRQSIHTTLQTADDVNLYVMDIFIYIFIGLEQRTFIWTEPQQRDICVCLCDILS